MKTYKLIKEYPGSPEVGTIRTVQNISIECEYPEFWEEVEDKNPLNLEVGKEYLLQYVHCKSEPIRVKITRFTQDGYPWKEGVNCDTNGIVSPDCWKLIEEIVEKDYEILSYQSKDKIIAPATNFAIEITKLGHWNTHSVKRLADGEVFTIKNRVKYRGDNYTISRFKTLNEKGLVGLIGIQHLTYLNEIQHIKNPLFTTEDGVDIFEGDRVACINKHTFQITGFGRPADNPTPNKFLYFSTKEAAEEYILMNKPCLLSINDIKFLQTIPDFELVKSLKKVVKSKL